MNTVVKRSKWLTSVEVYDNGDVFIIDPDFKHCPTGVLIPYVKNGWKYPWIDYIRLKDIFASPIAIYKDILNNNELFDDKGIIIPYYAGILGDFYLETSSFYGLQEIALDSYPEITVEIPSQSID